METEHQKQLDELERAMRGVQREAQAATEAADAIREEAKKLKKQRDTGVGFLERIVEDDDIDYKLSSDEVIKVCKILLHKINYNYKRSVHEMDEMEGRFTDQVKRTET